MTELRSGTVDKMADIFTKFIWQPYSQSIHLYTVWKFFEPSIVGASWNWKANTMKNQCIDKKAFFLQYVIRESRAREFWHLRITTKPTSVTTEGMNDRYFCKMHLATLALTTISQMKTPRSDVYADHHSRMEPVDLNLKSVKFQCAHCFTCTIPLSALCNTAITWKTATYVPVSSIEAKVAHHRLPCTPPKHQMTTLSSTQVLRATSLQFSKVTAVKMNQQYIRYCL